ncbi:uncharacterized protein LOC142337235 isoform X2 [Convolutriloba macropyga]|uniref:uncharacterized protein LOC142337235 isoform X2 n=1 Tax=Convolutriloba macropyga TaxID=536237 RepID=UPI003F51BD47
MENFSENRFFVYPIANTNWGNGTIGPRLIDECGNKMTIMKHGCEHLYQTLAHELIHQWTGGLITNEWWSNFWLNEGFTTFFQSEVARQLIIFKRMPLDSNEVMKSHDLLEFTILENVTSSKAAHDMDFFGFSAEFYQKASTAVSLLDAAMGNNLMVCLGIIFDKFAFKSLKAKVVVDELTECPYSTVNVTEFMRYWLFDEEVPILRINIDYKSEKSEAIFTYSYLCNITQMRQGTCYDEKPDFKPHFAIVIRDPRNRILQNTIMVSKNGTKAELQFDYRKIYPLFFVNAFDYGNFLVLYPHEVYAAFFKWVNEKIFANKIKLPPFYKVFTMDLFELSRRNKTDMIWLYKIMQNQNRLVNAGLLDEADISEFEKCLDDEFFPTVPKESKIQEYSCKWKPYPYEVITNCTAKVEDIYEFAHYGTQECKDWVAMFGQIFKKILEANIDSANFTYFQQENIV